MEQKIELGLPSDLREKLKSYQQEQHHEDIGITILSVLNHFFAETEQELCQEQRIHRLEEQMTSFSQELIALRQKVPEEYDQLRSQLATVRLSHSGLLGNLRERLEILENKLSED